MCSASHCIFGFSEIHFPDSWMFWFLNHRIASMKWLSVKWIVPFAIAQLLNLNDREVCVYPPVPWCPKCVLWFKAVFAPLSHGMNSRGRFNASQFHSVSSQGGVFMSVRDRVCTPPCDETPWNCEALKVKLKHPRLFIPWLRGANTALNHETHFG
jgi:hypothetical protein